jgi:hypothetical protein
MPIRRSLFGELRGVPSTARRGWASSRSPGGQAKRGGVSDGSRRDETPSVARCAARQRDPASPVTHDTFNADAQGFVEPGMGYCPNPRIRRTAFTHLRETTEPQIRRSGFVPKHGYRCTATRIPTIRQSAIQRMKCFHLKITSSFVMEQPLG